MEFASAAEADIAPGLTKAFFEFKRQYPNQWKAMLGMADNNTALLEYIVIALEKTGPVMVIRQFDYFVTVTPGGDPSPDLSRRTRIVMGGQNDLMEPDSAKMNGLSFEERAVAAIQVEIDNHPKIVGWPISVLLIKKSGLTWLRRGLCN
jgi:hypothetical protein